MALVENDGPGCKLPTAVYVPSPYAAPLSVTAFVPKSREIQLVASVEVKSTPAPTVTKVSAPKAMPFNNASELEFTVFQFVPSEERIRPSAPTATKFPLP